MTARILFVVVELPSGRFLRVDFDGAARGVLADGSTWDGTVGFSPEARAAIEWAGELMDSTVHESNHTGSTAG